MISAEAQTYLLNHEVGSYTGIYALANGLASADENAKSVAQKIKRFRRQQLSINCSRG